MEATVGKRVTKSLVSVRINSQLLDRLDDLAERIGRTRSELIDRAVEEYLNREASPAKPRPPRKS